METLRSRSDDSNERAAMSNRISQLKEKEERLKSHIREEKEREEAHCRESAEHGNVSSTLRQHSRPVPEHDQERREQDRGR